MTAAARVALVVDRQYENLKKAQQALTCGGGVWTPATAMGQLLIERPEKNAGLCFKICDPTISTS